MQPIVSVIIPVYNSGDYLTVQVDSILVQTFKDFELLLVDDGSTDGVTPQLCDELAAKDSRIVVFHKKNGGVSDSRNYGLDRARGEFIAFADHDDYMYPDHLQTMVEEIEDLDLLICTYATETREQINTYKKNDTRELVVVACNENEMRDGVPKMGYKNAPVWNQLFKKEIISKYNIRFQKIQYEDELFSYTYFMHVESFKRINFEGYYWINNSNSQGSSHKYIAEMVEWDWHPYPIMHLDLNTEKYDTKEALENKLELFLSDQKAFCGRNPYERCLVDEYDKPMLQAIGKMELQEEYRSTLNLNIKHYTFIGSLFDWCVDSSSIVWCTGDFHAWKSMEIQLC